MSPEFRSGIGYDLHRLVEGRRLVLGGIEIPFEKGLAGHSDGDVILHALSDALLGAIGQGDIGQLFPPSDPQWKDADSEVFLRQVCELVKSYGYRVVSVDVVLVLERPKISPHSARIRENLAQVLGIQPDHVGVKAKTAEGLGPIGEGKAAEAHAIVMISRDAPPRLM